MSEPPMFLTVDDYEPVARERLPVDVYDYYAGGAGDEITLRENRRAFDRWVLRPRFLRAAGRPDPSTTVFGAPVSFPVIVAPWAYQRLAHPDGEEATTQAAPDAGTVMVLSSTAYERLDQVARASSGPKWWQMYVATDRGFSADMLARVAAAGYAALVWTVDFPVAGLRYRDARRGFQLLVGLQGAGYEFDPAISWDDIAWIREHAQGLPVIVKGLLTAEDALLALEHGADGIVVSNHGGRQLDSSPASLDALPEIAQAIDGRIPVLMDGGVRRGTDVLKALALGATAVLVGRPIVWGLAVGGRAGVVDVLRILRDETLNAMALTGCRTTGEITRELVAAAP